MSRIVYRILLLLATTALVSGVFFTVVRPRYLDWGATPDERQRPLPGDEIVPDAATQETRAITIHAPASTVWPWLAQTGQDRGGFYSFDLLENLVGCEMPTVDVLRPDKQVWHVGDKLWMYPSDKAGGAGFATLRMFEPGRALGFGTRMVGRSVQESENGSWTFVLEPIDDRSTRLLIRGRGEARHSLLGLAFDQSIFEPLHFAMERRMLLGLKQVAETGTRNRELNHVHVMLWVVTAIMAVAAAIAVMTRARWGRPLVAFILAATGFQVLTLGQPTLFVGVPLVILTGLTLRDRGIRSRELRTSSSTRRIQAGTPAA